MTAISILRAIGGFSVTLFRKVTRSLPMAMLLAVSAACAVPLHANSPPSLCLGPDSVSANLLTELKTLLSATDTANVNWRTRLNLTSVAANQVTLTTTANTCQAAVTAVNTLRQHVTTGRKVYVFKLGNTQYAVWDPASADVEMASGYRMLLYFTSAWVYKSGLSR